MAKEVPHQQDDFRGRFRSSDRFDALINNTELFLKAHPQAHLMDFLGSFAGRLFEELGYQWYSERLKASQRLLNPDQTIEYFLELYGGKPSQTLLQGGIFNEYVPDGIILGDEVKGDAVIVEYTVRGLKRSSLPKYIRHKGEMAKSLRKRFPEIFGQGRLEIIFTEDTHPIVRKTKGVDSRTTLLPSPFKHDDVHAFAQELVSAHFKVGK